MKSRIYFKMSRAEFFDTGHEINDLTCLVGATILSVDDPGDEGVLLLIEHRRPQKSAERRKTVRSAVQQTHGAGGKVAHIAALESYGNELKKRVCVLKVSIITSWRGNVARRKPLVEKITAPNSESAAHVGQPLV